MDCYADESQDNENDLPDYDNGYDIESIFENISMIQDDVGLNQSTAQLVSECEENVEYLKNIQEYAVDQKSVIDSGKYCLSELEELQNVRQEDYEIQKKQINEKRLELEKLKSQKVNDLAKFENQINTQSEDFITAPKEYNSRSLMESISQLEEDISEKIAQLNQYQGDMLQDKEKFKDITSYDTILDPLEKIFDEDITDINSLDNKLKLEVQKLESELDKIFDEDITDINSLDNKLKLEVQKLESELDKVRVKFYYLQKLN